MRLADGVREALGAVRAHRMRAAFVVLGTVVGVTFLTAVVTLINGTDAYVQEDLARKVVGFNTVTVRRTRSLGRDVGAAARAAARRPPLTLADAEWLAGRMRTPGVLSVSTRSAGTLSVPGRGTLDEVRITAASGSYFRATRADVARGRTFSETEARRGLPVVVLGHEVADRLFPDHAVLGRTVRVHGLPFRVVGVLEPQGSLLGFSFDRVAIAPARSPLNGVAGPRNVVEEIAFRVPDASLLDQARGELEGWMRVRRGLRPTAAADFEVSTSESALSFWRSVSRVLMLALPGLVGISLFVGGLVIANVMLVVVVERTREIGVRRALGARRRDVLLQFLVEAGTLSGAGGALGIVAGAALAAAVSALSPLPARLAPWSVAAGVVLGVGVGLAAGTYPALRASRLDPLDALRQE